METRIATLLIGYFLTTFSVSGASYSVDLTTYYNDGTSVPALLDAACSGNCKISTGGTDTLYLNVQDGFSSGMTAEEIIWDLTDYTTIIFEAFGGNSLVSIPKKSEIRLSSNSAFIIEPTNTDGFIAGNNGNTYMRIGTADYHGNLFDDIIDAGGATESGLGGPLPVELLYFEGHASSNGVELSWATASELMNDYFIIERSFDAYVFEEIGKIQGAGDSYSKIDYQFNDDNDVLDNDIVYYRLTQVDYNGDFEVFDIVAVDVESLALSARLDVYPNPTSGYFTLYSSLVESTETISYSISNIWGGEDILQGEVLEGEYIDVTSLSDGVYKVHVRIAGQSVFSKLIVE